MRQDKILALLVLSCFLLPPIAKGSIPIRTNGGFPFVERVSVDDFRLQEVQTGLSLSKSNDLVIYDIEDQKNFSSKEIVGRAITLHRSNKSDYILTIRENLDLDEEDDRKNRRSAPIPATIALQTIRAFGYLLSRKVLLPNVEENLRSPDDRVLWIFLRIPKAKPVAAIARRQAMHANSAAGDFRDILDRFHHIAFGNSDEKDSALTGLDYVTGRIVLNEEYKK